MTTTLTAGPPLTVHNANDRFKDHFSAWFWRSVLVAALLHFLVLSFWPAMAIENLARPAPPLEVLEVLPEMDVPPPPERIERPAVPQLSADIHLSEEITIPPTTFDSAPLHDLPAPPVDRGVNLEDRPVFTPYEVKPELRNRAEFGRLLKRSYPPALRDAWIGGTVVLWVFIDESGTVHNTRVVESSGYEQLDRVAEEVMRQARFSPALNRDQRVPVWIQLPVTFQTR